MPQSCDAPASSEVAPTLLLVMTHRQTGLKYFCKTCKISKAQSYKGSGVYWSKHLKIYGRDIQTEVLGFYKDRERLVTAAISFSIQNNIVESPLWANRIIENGLDGAQPGPLNHRYGKPHPNKGGTRPELKGRYVGKLNPMYGKPSPMRGVARPKGKDSPLYGRKRPEGGGKPPIPVVRLDDGAVFLSIADAARCVGGTRSGITKCCLGKAKTAHGFRWSYGSVE